MAQNITSATSNLGFLTVLHEASGFLGGYLVTNNWGRPLEFRLSTAVQPNRVQQILYGGTLKAYIYGDLIGKTLVDKTGTPAQFILTDCEPVLEMRLSLEVPVAWVASKHEFLESQLPVPKLAAAAPERGPVYCHSRFPNDAAFIHESLSRLDRMIDLTEPFTRIRDAISEARKMGIINKSH
ncbi:MAG TPA: hypothetical protein VGY77_08150 [Gemmataceae bacterium]|jgi:hypothetical protein|nr:hypothetical protein [Gemmataceae bacterium]